MRRRAPEAPEPEAEASYRREHENGVSACVWTPPTEIGRCIAGTILFGAHASFARVDGLENAKLRADTDSGCPQPCDCPPWSAVEPKGAVSARR